LLLFALTTLRCCSNLLFSGVPDEIFEEVAAKEGFSPAGYLARYKWVFIDNINRLNAKEWEEYIKQSYDLIFAKLPVKIRKEITMPD